MRPFLAAALLLAGLGTATAADFDKPAIGAMFGEVATLTSGTKLKPPTKTGIIVLGVLPYTPAQKAGMNFCDIITHIDGKQVKTAADLKAAIDAVPEGKAATFRGYKASNGSSSKAVVWRPRTVKITPKPYGPMLLEGMTAEFDKIKGVTFYRHKDAPETMSERSDFGAYFGVKEGKPQPLRVLMTYVAGDWLFVRQYIIKAGDKTFTIDPGLTDVERDNAARRVWEWYDAAPKNLEAIIEGIMERPASTTIRYQGRQYEKDREVTPEEIARLYAVMMAHKYLSQK